MAAGAENVVHRGRAVDAAAAVTQHAPPRTLRRMMPRQSQSLCRHTLPRRRHCAATSAPSARCSSGTRTALEALLDAATIEDECDGWKLFMLAPRMLLFRAPGQSCVPVQELRCREQAFLAGHWPELLRHGAAAAAPAAREAARPSEGYVANGAEAEHVDLRRRSERAAALAHLGEPLLCHSRLQARRHSQPYVTHSGGHLNLKFPLTQSCVATA